jgi:Ribonuclease G/E
VNVRILGTASPGEVRVAVVQDGDLLDYALWRPGAPDGVGDIHRGRVTARVPAMAGAFVALDGSEGFLPDSEGAAGVTAGDILAVRITRAAQGGKGPRLMAKLAPGEVPSGAGSGPPARLAPGPGPSLPWPRG